LGWKKVESKLLPLPKSCKMGCETMRCSCRKAGPPHPVNAPLGVEGAMVSLKICLQ